MAYTGRFLLFSFFCSVYFLGWPIFTQAAASDVFVAQAPVGLFRVKQKTVPTPTIPPSPIKIEPVTAALTAVTVAATATGVAASVAVAANSPNGLITLLQALLPFVTLRKRMPPWGRVVENETGRPISGALVSIFDEAGRPRQTSTSRADGSFGALLPIGSYQIKIEYEGYELAHEKVKALLFPHEQLYLGNFFQVKEHENLVPIVAVMQRVLLTWEVDEQGVSVWRKVRIWQAKYATSVLLIGAISAGLTLLRTTHPLVIFVVVLYVLFLILELLLSRVSKRTVGTVRQSTTKAPIPLALVRLTDRLGERVIATEVTLPRGHFLLVPEPGEYQLHVIHPAYEPYIDKNFSVKRGSRRNSAPRIYLQLKADQSVAKPLTQTS